MLDLNRPHSFSHPISSVSSTDSQIVMGEKKQYLDIQWGIYVNLSLCGKKKHRKKNTKLVFYMYHGIGPKFWIASMENC